MGSTDRPVATPGRQTDEVTFDLGPIYRLADMLNLAIGSIPEAVPADFERGRRKDNRPELAALSRDLLRTADMARLLGDEITQLYWLTKGYDDPRKEGL